MKNLIIIVAIVLFEIGACYAGDNKITVVGNVDCYDHGCVVYKKNTEKSYFLGEFKKFNKNVQKCIDSGKEVSISGILIKPEMFDVKSITCKVVGN